jgi:hypothetical protein
MRGKVGGADIASVSAVARTFDLITSLISMPLLYRSVCGDDHDLIFGIIRCGIHCHMVPCIDEVSLLSISYWRRAEAKQSYRLITRDDLNVPSSRTWKVCGDIEEPFSPSQHRPCRIRVIDSQGMAIKTKLEDD